LVVGEEYLEPAVVRPEAGRLLVEERCAPDAAQESGDGARELESGAQRLVGRCRWSASPGERVVARQSGSESSSWSRQA
jgi:hypothetical protein